MIKLLDNSRVSLFDYFYLLTIIIFAGQASAFARGFGDMRTIGNAIPLALTFLFFIYKRVSFKKEFFLVVGFFSLYSAFVVVTTGSIKNFIWGYSRWVVFFFIAYVICKGYGRRLFVLAETVLFHLAIVGIIGWLLLLIIPVPFTNIIQSVALPSFNDNEEFTSGNILIYTIIYSSVTQGSGEWYSLIRNSGFAWEPGAFACFMCIAICCNVIRTNFRIKKNIPLIVLLVALASTESTTGYSTFGIMLAVWLIRNKKFVWLMILVPVFLFVMDLPFMTEKINYRMIGFSDATLNNAKEGEAFDRMLSFRILWDEFLRHPVLGYGYSESNIERYGLLTWSGIGRLLAQYGAIMSFLFFFSLIKSAIKVNAMFSCRSGVLFIVAIVGSMISYMLWTQPFYMAIWLSCIFIGNPVDTKKSSNNLSISDAYNYSR